ncbi:MAG TPA: hypothetical protein VGB42_08005 [Candidatus Thermoplasmatota archaeon]
MPGRDTVRGVAAAALISSVVLAGCFPGGGQGGPTEIDIGLDWEVEVTVTNDGDGFGGVAVTFASADSVDTNCPVQLAPGGSCVVRGLATEHISQVDVDPNPADGHEFMGWSGACSGGEVCTLEVPQESTVRYAVGARFDPASE